jgi:hypothetical protein
MRQALKLHPDSRCDAATRIEVYVSRGRPGNLVLRYFVTGTMSELRMPPVTAPTRADELWRHTCLEAFVRAPLAKDYYEFNFSPSTQWAAYKFGSYRDGMSIASEISAPRIEVWSNGACCEMQVSLDLSGLPTDSAWRLGLAAVIEEANGRISYWALKHPPGKADFHHSDCFTLDLAAA